MKKKKYNYYPVYIANPENCPHDGIRKVAFHCSDCGSVWIDKADIKKIAKEVEKRME